MRLVEQEYRMSNVSFVIGLISVFVVFLIRSFFSAGKHDPSIQRYPLLLIDFFFFFSFHVSGVEKCM